MMNNNAQVWAKRFYSVRRRENLSLSTAAEKIGISQSGLSKLLSRDPVSSAWRNAMDKLGYDIEITFVRREENK